MDIVKELITRNAANDGMFPILLAAAVEIERLRAIIRVVPCPGGGWTGMPDYIKEAEVGHCVDHGVCGCVYGAALQSR